MKIFTSLFAMLFVLTTWANVQLNPVQYKKQDSDHIKEILKSWHKTKGEYLYESISALVMNEEQPTRPNGVTQTPFEMLQSMGDQRIDRLSRVAEQELENEIKATRGNRENYYWREWNSYVQSAKCSDVTKGRSNGDPHMTTFDGQKYDFQNAGDYLLAGSINDRFMIQTQMFRPNNSTTISQNGKIAMNVNGDVVEFKDRKIITINGESVSDKGTTYVLPQGGAFETVSNNKFRVKFPTGEQAIVKRRGGAVNSMYDVEVYVSTCNDSEYYGLLGDNDGNPKNDLMVEDQRSTYDRDFSSTDFSYEDNFGANRRNPGVRSAKQSQGYYISNIFGDNFMLDDQSSLFAEKMTNIPDDFRYPSEHLTLAELSDEQIEEGIKKAREAGVADEDLFAAVYDYGHIGLEPEADTDDYTSPKRKSPKEPVIEDVKTNQGNQKTNAGNTRTNTGRTVIIVPSTPRTPVYRHPGTRHPNNSYPTGRTPQNSNPRPTGTAGSNTKPNQGTSTNRRTPTNTGGTRTPSSGGTRTPTGGR